MKVRFSSVRKVYRSGSRIEIDHLEIAAGERIGLVGNNGAGKTTMLRLMLGLLRFQSGDVRLDDESVQSFDLSWRSRMSSYLSESSLIPFLTPQEFWEFVGAAYGLSRSEQTERMSPYGKFVEATARAGRRRKLIRDFSEGNRKKIGLLAAMMVRPSLLVLDEPFAGLDPRSRSALEDWLLELNAAHRTTVIVSSHDLDNVVNVAGRILLMDNGRIVLDGESGPEIARFIRKRLEGGCANRGSPSH